MRRLHLEGLTSSVTATLRRFPLVFVVVALVAGAAQVLVDVESALAIRIVVAGSFAVPALVASALRREMRPERAATWIADAVVLGVALLFAWQWPAWTDELGLRRLAQANLGGLLAVAVLPFVGRGGGAVFWPFNRTMFVRFVVASIFAGVLFVGIGLAVAAVETLFGASVDDDVYARLFFFLVTVFHPLFVLGGVPEPLRAVADDTDFPRPLRVFAQSILLPLVVLYLLILLAYFGRVVLTQEWPQGWIGWLVSAVAAAGLLAVLLLDPVARERRGGWVPTAARVYFAAMIPALVMLLMALGQRVAQYGFTENRYFLGALAVWMLVLCLTRTLRGWSDPRWIPGTLALVVVLTSVGPWGAYAVSRASQSERLEELLAEAGRLENGVAVADTTGYAYETAVQVRDTIRYLVSTHGREAIDPWFGDFAAAIDASDGDDPRAVSRSAHGIAERAVAAIGLAPEGAVRDPADGEFDLHFTGRWADRMVDLGGATRAIRLDLNGPEAGQTVRFDEEISLYLVVDDLVLFAFDGPERAVTHFRVDLGPVVERAGIVAPRAGGVGSEEGPVILPVASERWTGRLVVADLWARSEDGQTVVRSLGGWLALGRR